MMKEADSSGILQKLNKTCICTTSEINNDYATKDHSYTQNIVTIAQEITSMKKKKKKKKNSTENNNKKKKKKSHQTEDKMIQRKRRLPSY